MERKRRTGRKSLRLSCQIDGRAATRGHCDWAVVLTRSTRFLFISLVRCRFITRPPLAQPRRPTRHTSGGAPGDARQPHFHKSPRGDCDSGPGLLPRALGVSGAAPLTIGESSPRSEESLSILPRPAMSIRFESTRREVSDSGRRGRTRWRLMRGSGGFKTRTHSQASVSCTAKRGLFLPGPTDPRQSRPSPRTLLPLRRASGASLAGHSTRHTHKFAPRRTS